MAGSKQLHVAWYQFCHFRVQGLVLSVEGADKGTHFRITSACSLPQARRIQAIKSTPEIAGCSDLRA